jgi:hypothetical protein
VYRFGIISARFSLPVSSLAADELVVIGFRPDHTFSTKA